MQQYRVFIDDLLLNFFERQRFGIFESGDFRASLADLGFDLLQLGFQLLDMAANLNDRRFVGFWISPESLKLQGGGVELLAQLVFSVGQFWGNAATDIDVRFGQEFEERSRASAFAGVEGESVVACIGLLSVQFHQQVDVKAVIVLDAGEVAGSEFGTGDFAAEGFDKFEAFFDRRQRLVEISQPTVCYGGVVEGSDNDSASAHLLQNGQYVFVISQGLLGFSESIVRPTDAG
ncbi:hypothetical protein CKA32_004117 [Geitlerinema sp. FC II]|nr:hypothetical protein CKA32_004117 [Geitlerinema sp. FC II]